MVPNSRATFKEYCLRKLGKPVIEINIDDDQLDDRIDEAIQYYYDNHFDGSEKVYYKYQITAQDITNKYIAMPDNILGVVEIFDLGGAFGTNNMFNIRYQIALNDLYNLTNVSIAPFVMSMNYISFLEEQLVGKQPIRYNRNTNLLYIDQDWDMMVEGSYLIVVAYQVVNPDVYVKAWRDYWLQEYACCLIKLQWANNLSKFVDMPMPGGMRFNATAMRTEAAADKLRIEKEIRESALPTTDMIG